jgi:type IV pilus assembly protein PilE
MPRPASERPARGVTLMELMIAVAIIGILGAVAWPQYSSYSTRANRSAVAGCLLEQAQFMERVYASNMRYDQNNGAATTLPATACRTNLASAYTIQFATGQPGQRTYVIQAVPQGQQSTRDTACGTLGLNQAGDRTKSGTAPTVAECWR